MDNTGDVFGYTCPCLNGFFKVNENDKTCHDMNECTTTEESHNKHDCDTHADCTNNFGSYSCTCHDGWTGDGHTKKRSCINIGKI